MPRLSDGLAIRAACIFIFLAAYRIELPGLYMNELDFVNAAQGAPDNTMIYMRLGPVPLLVFPYIGALKAWIYTPIFRLFAVSALTIRLPVILIAAVTLLIFSRARRRNLGAFWPAVVGWIIAVDTGILFPSRLDWGPTVWIHFFQGPFLALCFSYRDKPQLWKPVLIFICFGLGFFDKFNFVWLILAFVIGICLCYPDSLKNLWLSCSRFTRWVAVILILVALGVALYLVLPLLLHFHPTAIRARTTGLEVKWDALVNTLSGFAVAYFIFGDAAGVIRFTSAWLIAVDGFLALACLSFPMSDAEARENRKNGFFCLLIGFLIFLQIVITPQAGGPHHYSMIFPLPLLAFAFLARSLYTQLASKNLRRLAAVLLGSAAVFVFAVNVHNTAVYLSHFRTNSHYGPHWSPEIYSLSDYINEHGFEAKSIICVDWGLHNQLHALAPMELRRRMRDCWPIFKELDKKNEEKQTATLHYFFPVGKSLVVTFVSTETFPETQRNFFASLATHPELESRLAKEFWFGGEKIYELYEVVRRPDHR